MKKIVLIFLLFISQIICYADNQYLIDSLESILHTVTKEDKIKILNKLSFTYRVKSPEKTLEYGQQALELSEKLKNKIGKYNSLSYIGLGYRYLSNYEKALSYQLKALSIANELGDEKRIAVEYNRIGIIYKKTGNYDKALEYYLKSLKIREETGKSSSIASLLNNIGNIYFKRGDYEKALEYYFKTLNIRNDIAAEHPENISNKEGLSYILNNIGNIYLKLENYDKAIEFNQQSLKIKKEIGNKYGIATSLGNIGEAYLYLGNYQIALEYLQNALNLEEEMGNKSGIANIFNYIGSIYTKIRNFDKALEYISKSMIIRKEIGDKYGIISSLINFSNIQIILGNYNNALKYLDEALVLAREENLLNKIKKIYSNYSDIYISIGKYQKALEYYRCYSEIKDSIFNNDINNKITELQINFRTEKQEKENEILRQKNKIQKLNIKRQKQLVHSLITVTILVFILVFLIHNRYRNKKKAEQKLKIANATKDKFFSIIAHDLKNPFNAIMGFSNILYEEFKDFNEDEKKQMIKNIYEASENTYRLLQNLLEWSRSQTGSIEVKPKIIDLSVIINDDITILLTNAQKKKIKLHSDITFNTLAYVDENMIRTVTRNLISNAIKFTDNHGDVKVFAKESGNTVEVYISDTGIGISEDNIQKLFKIDKQFRTNGTANEKGTGLGLILCKEFIKRNGGEIWVESEEGKGSQFIFTLPKTNL
ncbi:MAG: tetratricopeptide repeat-containing sensor histidine kinase, partial [Bacteroidales bacterium]|nr:tetratricopeptide repeat-containing sensor histidine kinase [Bacteroidales bacterium]